MKRPDGAPAPRPHSASGPGSVPTPSAVRQFFRKGGALARSQPGYEFRPGQLDMAEAVESALTDGRHLIVEAGTGTGKTLAYLVPLICSGKRVVISTGTKNLQEQLFFKDIPFLEKCFPGRVRVCYMKGRANYACRQKIYAVEAQPILEGLQEVADFQIIRDWEKNTAIGDRAEIRTLPESSSAWAKVDARRELCSGQKCPEFQRCFITLMRQRAAESDIIVVNHHLFFADLGLKGGEHASLLPDYQAVVFDEAHEVEDVAAQYFGVAASSYRFEELCRDIDAVARVRKFGSAELDRTLEMLGRVAGEFFGCFEWLEGRRAFNGRQAFLELHQQQYDDLLRALELTGSHLQLLDTPPDEVIPLFQRTVEIAKSLQFIMQSDDRSMVHWLERRGRGVFLQATPIDVAPILAERLFDRFQTVILTSATLAVAGGFEFTRKRLGVAHCRSLVVPGHFDYQSQALLYVPPHLPDPRDAGFIKAASEEIVRLLEITRGRAFVLFTSYQSMRLMYDRISLEIDYPTLLQGSGPRTALLDEFRSTPNCVLFATSSFWQGVDVPGDQLSCVIIDKLPFAVPSDPVVEARIRTVREQGGNPFYDYQVPQAAIALKQGFGRLVRSRTDRGVLAILDNRITRQRYGQVFLDSLPDYRFTDSLDDVRGFFDV